MKIGRLLGKFRGTISRLSRMGRVGLYMGILGVFLSLGMIGGIPAQSDAHNMPGVSVFGIWVGAHVNMMVTPAGSGTVTASVAPEIGSQGQDIWPSGTIFTAIPTAGWSVKDWYMPLYRQLVEPTGWVAQDDQTHLHMTFADAQGQLMMVDRNGCLDITAVFEPTAVQIELKTAAGFTFVTPVGQTNVPLNSSRLLEVSIQSSYSGLYEFGGWIGNIPLVAYDNSTSTNTHIDVTSGFFPTTTGWWCQPSLKLKAGTSTVSILTDSLSSPNGQVEGDGGGWSENSTFSKGIGEVFAVGWDDNSENCTFLRWELSNMAAGDLLSAYTNMWSLAAGSATATALVVGTSDEMFEITIVVTGVGTTNPTIGSWWYQYGNSMIVTATAGTGYNFSHWNGVNGSTWDSASRIVHVVTESTTLTAVFTQASGGGGGGAGGGGGTVAAEGIWGGIIDSLTSVGLGNPMGRMMVVLAGMVVAAVVCGKNKTMRVVAPLGVLGIGIIGFWVPIWIVILLAIGVGVGLLGMFGKKTAA